MRGTNDKMIVIALHEGNLYQKNFIKEHEVDAINLPQSWKDDNVIEFWHC